MSVALGALGLSALGFGLGFSFIRGDPVGGLGAAVGTPLVDAVSAGESADALGGDPNDSGDAALAATRVTTGAS